MAISRCKTLKYELATESVCMNPRLLYKNNKRFWDTTAEYKGNPSECTYLIIKKKKNRFGKLSVLQEQTENENEIFLTI